MKISSTLRRTFSLYGAQILNLILGWVIAKFNVTYLSVAEYGQFNFFITAVNSIFIFFTFGVFESSSRLIALTEDDKEYRKILAASLTFSFFSYILFTIIFILASGLLDFIFKVEIGNLIKILFPLAGVYLFYDMWQKNLRGAGKIYHLSWLISAPRVVYILCLIFLVLSDKYDLINSLFSNLLSLFLIVVFFTLQAKPDFEQLKSSSKRLAREIRRFGVHMYWGELINALLYQLDKLMIAFFLDAEQLAYYSLAFTITLPLSLFSTSLSTSLYRRFSRIEKIDKKILYVNLVWVSLSIIILVFLRKWIILNLFSDKYLQSLQVFVILAVAFGVGGISKLYTYFLTAKGAGIIIKNIAVAVLILNFFLNLILIPKFGILGAATSRLSTSLFDFFLLIFYYSRHSFNTNKNV